MIASHLQRHLQLQYLDKIRVTGKKVASWPFHSYFPALRLVSTVCLYRDSPYSEK